MCLRTLVAACLLVCTVAIASEGPRLQPDELALHNAELAGHGTRLAVNRYWYEHEKWPASVDALDYELSPGNTSDVTVDAGTGVVTVRVTEPAEVANARATFTPTLQADLGIEWVCVWFDLPAYVGARPC
jgi:hypothetical protein